MNLPPSRCTTPAVDPKPPLDQEWGAHLAGRARAPSGHDEALGDRVADVELRTQQQTRGVESVDSLTGISFCQQRKVGGVEGNRMHSVWTNSKLQPQTLNLRLLTAPAGGHAVAGHVRGGGRAACARRGWPRCCPTHAFRGGSRGPAAQHHRKQVTCAHMVEDGSRWRGVGWNSSCRYLKIAKRSLLPQASPKWG